MPYECTQSFASPVQSCYEAALLALARRGCRTVRRRDLAWLVQAAKEVDGKLCTLNITCRPGATTQVTVACVTAGEQSGRAGQDLAEGVLQDLAQLLADGAE